MKIEVYNDKTTQMLLQVEEKNGKVKVEFDSKNLLFGEDLKSAFYKMILHFSETIDMIENGEFSKLKKGKL